MKMVAVIPARYQSTRLPGKPLADIMGKPMIWWVYQQVKKVRGLASVVVATEDKRIQEKCEAFGMECMMTNEFHKTSTERLYEVAQRIEADYYLCINGDEPMIQPETIEAVLEGREKEDDSVFLVNGMTRIKDPVELMDTSNIKVVTDSSGKALYFSRQPIPYPHAGLDFSYYKHLGILLYNKKALEFFSHQPMGKLEKAESINELRFLEAGYRIQMIEVEAETLSVDTQKDLERVRKKMAERVKR